MSPAVRYLLGIARRYAPTGSAYPQKRFRHQSTAGEGSNPPASPASDNARCRQYRQFSSFQGCSRTGDFSQSNQFHRIWKPPRAIQNKTANFYVIEIAI
jgi:hypothetical protein